MRRSGSPAPPQQWEAAVRHHLCGGALGGGAGVTRLSVTDETLSADAGTLSLGDGAREQSWAEERWRWEAGERWREGSKQAQQVQTCGGAGASYQPG